MAGNLQPLDQKFAIVDNRGQPTDYFIRWAQQRQLDIGEAITLQILEEYFDAHPLQQGSGIQITPPSGSLKDGPLLIDADAQEILDQIATAQGTILYRNAADWVGLAPGAAGNFLQTQGAGANPIWAAGGSGANDYLTWMTQVSGGRYAPTDWANFNTSTVVSAADHLFWFPFSRKGTIDAIAVEVTTAVAGNVKAAIYDCTSSFFPGNKLQETPALSTGSIGTKNLLLPAAHAMVAPIWIGLLFSAAPTLRAAVTNGLGAKYINSSTSLNVSFSPSRFGQANTYVAGFPAVGGGSYTFFSGTQISCGVRFT